MSKSSFNKNHIRLHTSVRKYQREYLMQLSRNPELTESQTIAEIVSLMLASFLSREPYRRDNWEWERPSGYYSQINGVRVANADWVPLHPDIVDIKFRGVKRNSHMLIDHLESVARHLPKIRAVETGMSMAIYNVITWGLTELYPPEIYGVNAKSPDLKIKIS